MLTERRIREAKPNQKTRILWDGQIKGLGVRITPAGVKSYILNYRVAGREKRATLARVPELSLNAARSLGAKELNAIRAGEVDMLERRRKVQEAPTVAEGLARFFEEFVPARIEIGRMTERTAKEYSLQARSHVEPSLGKLRVADVTRRDIERMVKNMPGTTRNRHLAFVSRLFSLFETWEWRPQNTNPVRGIERAREQARDRILDADELGALSRALHANYEAYPSIIATIRFAAVTGLRIGEILKMQWSHINSKTRILTLPETKTGRRSHHLSSASLAILTDLPRLNKWVFSVVRDAPLGYKTVRSHFARIATEAGPSRCPPT